MHICMIDENSHHSQTATKGAARTICFLIRKRAPIESLQLPPELLPASVRKNLAVHVSLSSCLHNVKEPTRQTPRHRKHQGFQNSCSEQALLLVAQQISLPLREKHQQWERNPLSVVNACWIYESQNRLSTPNFQKSCKPSNPG